MVTGALAAMLVSTGITFAQLEPIATNAWFMQSYVPAARRVEDVYTHLSMRAGVESIQGSGIHRSRHVRFVAFGGRSRIDTMTSSDGECIGTMIAADEEGVIIRRRQSHRLRGVRRIEATSSGQVLEQMRLVMQLPFAPWSFRQSSIRDLFLAGDARVYQVTVDTDTPDGRVCIVDWGFVNDGCLGRTGRFRFAMDRSWVLLEAESQLDSMNWTGICCRYGDEKMGDVPMIASADLWFRNRGGRRIFRTFQRKSFTPVTTPPDVFNPMIEQVVAELSACQENNPPWQKCAAAGVVGMSLIVAIYVPFCWRRRGPG